MVALAYYLRRRLPTAEDLPHSDETPVDNELQDDIPQVLKSVLKQIWANRQDWFFAIDMALYYNPDEPAIVPDAFLALQVERLKNKDGRLSYVLWEEDNTLPILALEVVSQKYNGEYDQKLADYQNLGILYYVIYNPKAGQERKYARRLPLEVYKWESGTYQLQTGNPVWLSEISLGIGRETKNHEGWEREWLYWYDQSGQRYPTNAELYQAAEEQRLVAEERIAELEAHLRSLGIQP
jgi:Uma2 family endonuclease